LELRSQLEQAQYELEEQRRKAQAEARKLEEQKRKSQHELEEQKQQAQHALEQARRESKEIPRLRSELEQAHNELEQARRESGRMGESLERSMRQVLLMMRAIHDPRRRFAESSAAFAPQVSELLGAVEELRTAKMELLNQASELRNREQAALDERDEISVCLCRCRRAILSGGALFGVCG
jgi:chromosome segregation ATPase